MPHPARDPRRTDFDHADAQIGVPLQHPVDHERVERLHDRQRDREVVDRLEVAVAAVEVGHRRQAVLEERPGSSRWRPRPRRAAPPAHRPRRHIAHTGSRSMWLGEWPGGQYWPICSAAAPPSIASRVSATAAAMSPSGTTHTGSRRGSTEHHSSIARCCPRATSVANAGVAGAFDAQHVRARERVEHELAREAEEVQRPRPVVFDERAGRGEVLAQQDLRLVLGPVLGIGVRAPDAVDVEAPACSARRPRPARAAGRGARRRDDPRATPAAP